MSIIRIVEPVVAKMQNSIEQVSLSEYLKHLLIIGTPLESPARELERTWIVWRNPNTRSWIEEDRCIDKIMQRLLNKHSNCIDIGCHLGSILSQIVKLAPCGEHLAFEPITYKAKWLQKKFPKVKVYARCLSSVSGEVSFYYCPQLSSYSSLKPEENKESLYEMIKVKCDRLDDLVQPGSQIDLIKIDVEGAELEVLRGARRILKESQPYLILECTASGTKRFGNTPADVYDFLSNECNYAIFLAKDWLDGGVPIDREVFATASGYPAIAYNFFVVPKNKI